MLLKSVQGGEQLDKSSWRRCTEESELSHMNDSSAEDGLTANIFLCRRLGSLLLGVFLKETVPRSLHCYKAVLQKTSYESFVIIVRRGRIPLARMVRLRRFLILIGVSQLR